MSTLYFNRFTVKVKEQLLRSQFFNRRSGCRSHQLLEPSLVQVSYYDY